jgi:hypothetical protein
MTKSNQKARSDQKNPKNFKNKLNYTDQQLSNKLYITLKSLTTYKNFPDNPQRNIPASLQPDSLPD